MDKGKNQTTVYNLWRNGLQKASSVSQIQPSIISMLYLFFNNFFSLSISTVSYKINSGRYTPSLLRGMTFSSGVNDYVRLSSSALPITSEVP